MGSLKEMTRTNIEQNAERGNEVTETGQNELNDAQVSAAALDSLNCIDDDDRSAADASRSEAQSIAHETAEGEVRNPTQEIVGQLEDIKSEADEYAGIEEQDASTASGMEGKYSSTGNSLAESFRKSAQEFYGLGSEAQETGNQLESTNEQLASGIETSFG